MRIGEVADQFGVSTQTIRNWVREMPEFFSPGAKGRPGKQSDFTEDDVRVVNSIWSMTQSGNHNWLSIAENLRSGWRENMLPERAALVASTSAPAMQLAARAITAEDKLAQALRDLSERDQLLTQLQNRLVEVEKEKAEFVERVMREREELLREIGRIEKERAAQISALETELRLRKELKG